MPIICIPCNLASTGKKCENSLILKCLKMLPDSYFVRLISLLI